MSRYHRSRYRSSRSHHRKSLGTGFIGGVLGGFIGQKISEASEGPPEPTSSPAFDSAIKNITNAPEGAEVKLTLSEFRALSDKKMVNYVDGSPYVFGRKIGILG